MEHALHLLLLLVVTRLFGELSERLGQPASMGEIVAGMAIALVAAASLPIPLLASLAESPFLEVAAEFGIFFLLLLAGIEMRPREIAEHSGGSLAVALGGVLVPLGAGFALAWFALPETPLKFAEALCHLQAFLLKLRIIAIHQSQVIHQLVPVAEQQLADGGL